MNVCLLNDSFPPMIDGVANTVMNYADVISRTEGMSALVATPKYPKAKYDGYPYTVVPYASLNISRIVEGYRAGLPFKAKALSRICEFKPDIIHTHCPVISAMMGRILRNETDAPLVFTYHTKFDEDIAKAVKPNLLRKAVTEVLLDNISACDEVWTVSRGAGENLRSLGFEGDYRIVLNGVDFPKGRTSEEQAFAASADYDVPADVPVFLYVGRIMQYKGLPLIIDALKLLSEQGIDFRMIFIGGGVDAQAIRRQSVKTGLSTDFYKEDGTVLSEKGNQAGKVIFTGPIRDRELLRAWNTRAHLFLFPSTYDTNGIVVREAAACGLASVLIEGSCAAEEVTDGRNGFLIEETAGAMAEILKEVCEDPEKARTVGENAMEELYLSWEDSVRRACVHYEELLEKKREGLIFPREEGFSDRAYKAAAVLDQTGRKLRNVTSWKIRDSQPGLLVANQDPD